MPAWAVLVVLAAAAVAFLVVRHAVRERGRLPRALATCGAVMAAACLVAASTVCARAMTHGMQGLGMSLPAIERSTSLSPRDQSASLDSVDEAPGHVIVLYRFACPDCEETFDAIREAANGRDVLWVSSRSDIGHELCERYDVEWVPSVLSVSSDGHVVVRDLYADDLSGIDVAFDNLRNGD